MSITDDIRKNAKENLGLLPKEETESDRVLSFPVPGEYGFYRAFHAPTSDPQIRLRIRANKWLLMPKYDLLYDVPYTGMGDFVGLIFPHMQVKMYGRNLLPLVDRLFTNSVEWVCEFYPPLSKFETETEEKTAPCIEEIVIENVPLDPEGEIRARNNS